MRIFGFEKMCQIVMLPWARPRHYPVERRCFLLRFYIRRRLLLKFHGAQNIQCRLSDSAFSGQSGTADQEVNLIQMGFACHVPTSTRGVYELRLYTSEREYSLRNYTPRQLTVLAALRSTAIRIELYFLGAHAKGKRTTES